MNSKVDNSTFGLIGERCCHIEDLNLCDSYITYEGLQAFMRWKILYDGLGFSINNFKSLNIERCNEVVCLDYHHCEIILNTFPQLQVFQAEYVQSSIKELAISYIKANFNIQHLPKYNLKVTSKEDWFFSHRTSHKKLFTYLNVLFPYLQVLNLSRPYFLEGVDEISNLKSLIITNFDEPYNHRNEFLPLQMDISYFFQTRTRTNLRYLHLHSYTHVSLLQIIFSCPNLIELELVECALTVHQSDVAYLSQLKQNVLKPPSLKYLEKIKLNDIGFVDENDLDVLKVLFSNASYLKCININNVNGKSIEAIMESLLSKCCFNLEIINIDVLDGNTNFVEEILKQAYKFPKLTYISVHVTDWMYLRTLNDENVADIVSKIVKERNLDCKITLTSSNTFLYD
jgi:hypothetical protein